MPNEHLSARALVITLPTLSPTVSGAVWERTFAKPFRSKRKKMSSILEMLTDQLGGDTTTEISRRLGADEPATGNAITAALPMLMGALSRNTSRGDGAQSLAGALERDHDWSILDDVAGFLNNPEGGAGSGILRHVLGGKQQAVETELGRETGLDAGTIAKLLPMLAPLVMGALGRAQREQKLDSGGVASLLAGERQRAEETTGLGSLAMLLDSDQDGQIADDVADVGVSLLSKFLKRR